MIKLGNCQMMELIIRLENNGEGERHLTKKADDISLTRSVRLRDSGEDNQF